MKECMQEKPRPSNKSLHALDYLNLFHGDYVTVPGIKVFTANSGA